jgi:hypothetical protein
MTLSARHLQDVCLLGEADKNKTCRYLRNDDLDESKWYCQKLQQRIKSKIDKNILAMKERVGSSLSINMPSGDNCSGYPLLKHVVQGYDVNP